MPAKPTHAERVEEGRALRAKVPWDAHGDWTEPADRDPISILEAQAEQREPELVPLRYQRMAESPFAFYRGGAAIMARDLSAAPVTGLRVQACGDAHVANFGKFATAERRLVFDINDFDETLPGPWEWDVKRLCASLHVAARDHGFPPNKSDQVVVAASRAYRERTAGYADERTLELWYDRIDFDDVIAHFPRRYRPLVKRDIRKAKRKDHLRAVAKLTTDVEGHVRFVEDPPLVVALDRTPHGMDEARAMLESYRSTLPDDRRFLLDRFEMVDVARKVVGVGSVGTRCWIALFEGPDHPLGDRVVLQIKEAQASVLEPYVGESTLGHHGRRVVTGQRLTQGASDLLLGWCDGPQSGRQYYVRQLWDVKGQGDLTRMDLNNLIHYGTLCAWALARAHARTGDAAVLSGYLDGAEPFDQAMVRFSRAYADTNQRDHALLAARI